MLSWKKIIIALIVLISVSGIFFRDYLFDLYSKFSLRLPEIEKGIGNLIIQEIKENVSTPPPLRATEESQQAFLTRSGVIQWTNAQREEHGLPPLKESANLNDSARLKAEDMFKYQYFEHISPSGAGAGDLAGNSGYEFIAIGENLALGNFEDDKALVQAWMDSPGHRANILNEKYQDIGVSVVEGTFEGRTTWLAVQHFGLSLSSCPSPSQDLKTEIESDQKEIQALQDNLEKLKNEIQGMRPRRGDLYNQKVDEYNVLVSQYNDFIEKAKASVEEYNGQIRAFNKCAGATE
jgi:uncharacterized protein YkwD